MKSMAIFRSLGKQITRLLFVTLGTMWLSFAIAPCVLIAAVEKTQHDCCPDAVTSSHMHEQEQCDTCYMVQPVLKSADQFVLSSTISMPDYQPVIIAWNYNQTSQPVTNTYQLSSTVYQTLPPPLRYRVLLI